MGTARKSATFSAKQSLLPWTVDSLAMKDFLSTRLDDTNLERAAQWRRSKIAEIGVVNVVGALIAAVVSSAFTWPATEQAPWTVLATFYGALVLSLVAVSTGSQQCIALYRLGESRSALNNLQRLLKLQENSPNPKRMQKYLWQVPIMLLNVSILVFLVGLMILVWHRAASSPSWNSDMKIAFVTGLAGIFGLVNYGLGMLLLYQKTADSTAA